MAAVTKAFLEQAYLAYFGRPVDPNGALFWLQPGTTQADVVNGFSNSAESISLYGAPTVHPGLVFTQVNAIYNVLFGRDGDVAGVTWWANQIITGKVVAAAAAVEILNGAQGSDKTIVDNKLAASAAFTAGLDTIDEINGYMGDAATAVAREWLATVTTTPASPAEVDAAIADSVAASAPPPALTLAVDSPSVVEGNSGLQQLVFTLTLSAVQTTDTVVNFQTLDTGTATAGADFNPAAGAVTFVAGQTTATVTVQVKGDTVYEPNETVKVEFSGVALANTVTATGTIINDDILPQTFILTTEQDILTGGKGDDQFMATGATLQLGDMLNGGGGLDTLNLSLSNGQGEDTGFSAQSIETFKVKSLQSNNHNIDMSDVSGVTEIQSNESRGDLTFDDIQSVNSIDISVTDTSATHNFNYDSNAYTAGVDAVDLRLAEVTGSYINFDGGSSLVDQINIDSQDNPNPVAGDSDATVNFVDGLNVGDKLATVNITGNADLTVDEALDINVARVDAGTLDGNLTLDLSNSNDGNVNVDDAVREIVYIGAMQNDYVEFGSTNNAKDVTLGDGDDWVRTGTGVSSVNGGSGDDTIITGALNDLVIGGEGNDVVTDAGANNATSGWGAKYVSGGNSFDMGAGDDILEVTGGGNNNASLGDGHDTMLVGADDNDGIVSGNQRVTAGTGNDSVTLNANGWANVDLGAGDDSLMINRSKTANSTVTAGDGDDYVAINSNGNVDGTGGDGNDEFVITGNGGHTIDMGNGNDDLSINGDGTHNLTLGSGDDELVINGSRNTAGNADNGATDGVTVINAGDGNDTVYVAADHYLGADLGAGNDAIHLRAKDLTTDDTVAGGAGNDSIWLSNETETTADGRVLASETIHTTGFETYELLNSNITLKLTDQMITTAENMDLTVSTVNSNSTDLPGMVSAAAGYDWIYPLVQGMTNAQFDVLVQQTRDGDFDYTPNDPNNYLKSRQYYDDLGGTEASRLAAAEEDLRDYISQFVTIDNTDTNHDGDTTDLLDQLFFLKESGVQTIDMTGITTPEYKFTLDGGNVADVVIGNDASINGQMTLNYNFGGSGAVSGNDRTALSVKDTLVVIGGAEITAADLRNVTGLEQISLKGGGNGVPQTWGIELTDRVINQTTGSAALEIFVDPNVEAGSELYITLDPSVTLANNDVVIHQNANVTVYIDGNKVTEPQLGFDFNNGTYHITVVNQLNFTTNADHLVGTDGNDTFHAKSLNVITVGDTANGMGGFNTLDLQFAVNDGAKTLNQILGADLQNIQRMEFNTGNNVAFGGIGIGYAPALTQLATGEGNDTLTNMRQGLLYELNAGNDSIGLYDQNAGSVTTTVEGGVGLDMVTGSSGNDRVVISDVEAVHGGLGEDTVTITTPGSDAANELITFSNVESIYGSYGADNILADRTDADRTNIYVAGNSGNDTINVGHVGTGPNPNFIADAVVYGGEDSDSITVNVTNTALVYGDDGWWWNNGDDTISVVAASATVYAEDGNDAVFVTAANASVTGDGGDDHLRVLSHGNADQSTSPWVGEPATFTASVSGGEGADDIEVFGVSRTANNISVAGGSGDDNIYVYQDVDNFNEVANASISGGSGDDTIEFHTETGGTQSTVVIDGNEGADDIQIVFDDKSGWGPITTGFDPTVNGGSGDDIITVNNTQPTVIAATAVLNGNEGADTINVITDGWTTTITGGSGDDAIHLHVSTTAGADTLVFGDITYNGLQVENLNTQGKDTISGFNWEPVGPTAGAQDLLDFTAFNGGTSAVVFSGVMAGGGDVNVVSTTNDAFILTNGNWAGTGYTMANDERGVLIIAKDTDDQNGYDTFDVYYVQDVDAGVDVAVKVNLVGTIDSATNIGLTTITTANFVA